MMRPMLLKKDAKGKALGVVLAFPETAGGGKSPPLALPVALTVAVAALMLLRLGPCLRVMVYVPGTV